MSEEPVRVVVVDDQAVVREGLVGIVSLLEGVTVVGDAGDGVEALEVARAARPDVVLMDLRMPRRDGVEATRLIRAELPDTKVIVLTTYSDDESIVGALKAGAAGYLTKDSTADAIAAAISVVARGGMLLEPAIHARVLDALAPPAGSTPPRSAPDGLTPREVEVLGLMALGRTNHEIATELHVSAATVKTHVNNLFAKSGVRDRGQAVAYAYRHGIVVPPRPPTG